MSSLLVPASSSSLQLELPKLGFHPQTPRLRPPFLSTICCGLRRSEKRKPLWRATVMSTEAIQAVQALKLAKSSPLNDSRSRVADVFSRKIERLIKPDLVAVLAELQRQNECELALQVFAFIRKEASLKPDISLYSDMILMFGKNKLIEMAEKTFSLLISDGLQPNTQAYTEMIGAYLKVEMVDKAVDLYELMKDSGCNPDRLTLTILIRTLDKAGKEDLANYVRKECERYIEYPEKFLEEVDKQFPKRRSLKLV